MTKDEEDFYKILCQDHEDDENYLNKEREKKRDLFDISD